MFHVSFPLKPSNILMTHVGFQCIKCDLRLVNLDRHMTGELQSDGPTQSSASGLTSVIRSLK